MSSSVQTFYERNTPLFLRLGGGASTGSLHRAVWGENVSTREEAFTYPYALVAEQVEQLEPGDPLHVLDLGCGVGGGIFYLADALDEDFEATGISISPTQIRRARATARHREKTDDCSFVAGDFHDLPELPPVDLAFAIEAFVQARAPAPFFEEVAHALRPGGRLVIIDDVLRDGIDSANLDSQEQRWIETFRAGWEARSLRTRQQVVDRAGAHDLQLRDDRDLTPHLELGRPRDHFIAWCLVPLQSVLWRWAYPRSLIGGHALQQGLQHGLIQYRQLVFEKRV